MISYWVIRYRIEPNRSILEEYKTRKKDIIDIWSGSDAR